MKLGTVESLKFKKLKMRLGLAQWQAIGLLESLWMFTARNAPLGDIGRHSNEDIAVHLEWTDDADSLIAALIDCRWIDESDEHRLLIHDWAEHLPLWLQGNLKRHDKKPISTKQPAKQDTKQPAKDGALVACPEHPAIFSSDLISSELTKEAFSPLEENTGTAAGDAATFLKPMEALAERIWNAFPKKAQRGQVAKSLDAAILRVIDRKGCTDEQAFAWILAAVMEFASSPMGRLSPAEKLPSPSRWLDDDRYRDDRALWQVGLGDKPKPGKAPMRQIAGVNLDD